MLTVALEDLPYCIPVPWRYFVPPLPSPARLYLEVRSTSKARVTSAGPNTSSRNKCLSAIKTYIQWHDTSLNKSVPA